MQRFARLRHISRGRDRGLAVVAAQRYVRDRSGCGNSRLLPDGFEQAIEDSDALGRSGRKRRIREHELTGDDVIGAKAGRHGHHLLQAQPEQRGTREQNKRERDLRDDESMAKALSGATDRARA